MKLIIKKGQLSGQSEQFLRQAGYTYIRDHRSGKESFVKRLTRNFYPRFHMYVSQPGKDIVFDLHLDQKEASYPGAHAHNAEYDSEVVKDEIARLNKILGDNIFQ